MSRAMFRDRYCWRFGLLVTIILTLGFAFDRRLTCVEVYISTLGWWAAREAVRICLDLMKPYHNIGRNVCTWSLRMG